MKNLYKLKDMLCEELDEISEKQGMSAGDLDTAQKLTDTIKNIDKIIMLEDGYSQMDGGWEAHGSYSRDGDSYRRGPMRGRYSRDDGFDHDRKRMVDELEDMMRSADGERRESIRRALEELRKV